MRISRKTSVHEPLLNNGAQNLGRLNTLREAPEDDDEDM